MTDLTQVSLQEIEDKIMSILYSNMDIVFTQYALFNKLLEDKYDNKYTNLVGSNFKPKFLLVLKNLMEKYDDIIINKSNGIFSVVCVSESEKPIELNKSNKSNKFNEILEKQKQETNIENKNTENTNYFNLSDVYNYFYESNPSDCIKSWADPWEGNTFSHELVLTKNKELIIKLIDSNEFDFETKNKLGKNPIELSTDAEITSILAMGIFKKFILDSEKFKKEKDIIDNKIEKLENKIKIIESPEYKKNIILNTSAFEFGFVKSTNFVTDNRIYIISALICFLAIKMFF
jgi:hypothetical protein